MDVEVSIVVPTFRRPSILEATLAKLSRLDSPAQSYEIVIVDDGADDATREVVEAANSRTPAELRYIAQPNSGVATARNRGARLATGEIVIFLDDDMLVEPDHVRRHLAVHAEYEDCLVNGHWEFAPDVKAALSTTPFGRFRIAVEEWVKDGIAKTPLADGRVFPAAVTACNLSISRARFFDLGGFDEGFPFAGFEDYEFSHRAKLAGCRFVYDREIRLHHYDNRLSLEDFCERQRRGALTAVYLARKHPDTYASQPLIIENAPISRDDPFALASKKLVKLSLGAPLVLATAHAGVRLLERFTPHGRLLRRAYWAMCGVYIHKGIREGLAEAPSAGPVLSRRTA